MTIDILALVSLLVLSGACFALALYIVCIIRRAEKEGKNDKAAGGDLLITFLLVLLGIVFVCASWIVPRS